MSILTVFIPTLPPGLNQTYKTGKGNFYKSSEAKEWQAQASLIIGAEAGHQNWVDDSKFYEIELFIQNSRHDTDAFIKLVMDTLTQKLGFDDKRIKKIISEKITSTEKGLTIRLSPYEQKNS